MPIFRFRGSSAVLAALMLGSSALAQTTPQVLSVAEPDLGVMERERPAYDAKGIPLGGFRLFPSLGVEGNYDSNVFRLSDARSDYFLTLTPAVNLKSDWGRHFIQLSAYANHYMYSEQKGENLTDWASSGKGRLDISHAATMFVDASYGEYHELWSAPDAESFQAAPNRYYQTHVTTSVVYQPSQLGVSAGGSFDRYDWTETPVIGGGFLQNNDRNEDKYEGYLRVFYEFSPGYAAFVRVNYNDRKFDVLLDRSGIDRASHGYRYDGGLTLQISHLIAGELYVGYLKQDFSTNSARPLTDVSGIDYGVQLDWYATPVLTIHVGGNRQLADTIFENISVEDDKRVDLSADYELLRNLIVQGRAWALATKYTGSALSDTTVGAGLKVMYLINRYAAAHIEYGFERRTSNRTLGDYTDNTISIGLTLHV
jgi:hypothetical protein